MKLLTNEEFLPIFRKILACNLVDVLQQEGTIMEFLSSLWELRTMRSLDNRYTNLYDDIKKHWVDNLDDYDNDNLFFTRINILQDSSKFVPFIQASVNPAFIHNEEIRQSLVENINATLAPYSLQLTVYAFEGQQALYRVMEKLYGMYSADIVRNEIPVLVEKHPTGYSHRWSSHKTPDQFPCFVLVSDDGWSDGYAHVQFNLFFYANQDKRYEFGLVKLIKSNSSQPCEQANQYYVKNDGLPDNFVNLPAEFCTLGQTTEYYIKIQRLFPDTYMSIFLALRDAAVFSQIDDEFRNTEYYSCLTRENVAERNIREARLILQGRDIEERYTFDYVFQPKFADNEVTFHFGFKNPKQILARRMYAIIGKNGVGKTMFMSSLPHDLASGDPVCFHPAKPILSKVISLSESNFDNYEDATSNTHLNYVHCGMVKKSDDGYIPKNRMELSAELLAAYKKIRLYRRTKHLRQVLERLINPSVLNQLIVPMPDSLDFKFGEESLMDVMKQMSSGENIMYYLFCMLEAEMRYDSLVLLDEPETHLHPNAISEFICSLDDMLQEYESVCIMATHSPLLIRELSSDCVYVMERNEDISTVRKPAVETIGGNLTMLTDDIFGLKEVNRNYKRRLSEMAHYLTHDELVNAIKSKDLPLGLGIDLYIRSLYPSQNEEA